MSDSVEPIRKRRRFRSPVWEHFTLNNTTNRAKCNLCENTNYSYSSGSTTVLIRHLQREHGLLKDGDDDPDSNDIKDPTELVARLLSCAGIPFKTVAEAEPLRDLFNAARCSTVPMSPTGVRNNFMTFASKRRDEMATQIQEIISSGKKLSVSLDEWTSCGNRRYLNINLHDNEDNCWNLGLGRITGSFTSEACLAKTIEMLLKFGITFDTDIIGVITDGASVMKRFGQISGKFQQVCMAHGVHLAVLGVFYERTTRDHTEHPAVEVNEEDEDLDLPFQPDSGVDDLDLIPSINQVIAKVRKIVKLFKKSPLKDELLKNYVISAHGKELSLCLDVRTRWNSVLLMLERFQLLKNEVRQALEDLDELNQLTDEETSIVDELVRCLKPVKVIVDALCRRDANLISCDVALRFMMRKIKDIGSDTSKKLYESLKRRILERRSSLGDVLFYLNTRTLPEPAEYFNPTNKKQIINQIKNVAKRFSICQPVDLHSSSSSSLLIHEDSSEQNLLEDNTTEGSLEFQLNNAIKIAVIDVNSKSTCAPGDSSLLSIIKKEISLFEDGGVRGGILEGVFQMIKTIKPTSVESERIFSSSAYLCTKVRSRLADSTLDSLVFMRSYFQNC